MSIKEQQSILSLIPLECLNIIKDFNKEERKMVPMIVTDNHNHLSITKYKEGYEIEDKHTYRNATKENIYLDNLEDVVNYLTLLFFKEDEDFDQDPENVIICYFRKISTCCSRFNDYDKLEQYFTHNVKLIGKIYIKID